VASGTVPRFLPLDGNKTGERFATLVMRFEAYFPHHGSVGLGSFYFEARDGLVRRILPEEISHLVDPPLPNLQDQ
jgi:hypothetical protein